MPEHAMFPDDRRRSRLVEVDFSESRMHNIWMENTRITGADFINTEIWGSCRGLTWNGVAIEPLVEAELLRMFPERAKLKPRTPDEYREAWKVIEDLWAATHERARSLPEAMLHERVDGEFSFIETVRHLVGGIDSWALRCILGMQGHRWELSLNVREWGDLGPDPNDPPLDEAIAAHRDRMSKVRAIVDGLTDAEMKRVCDQNPEEGYPQKTTYPVWVPLMSAINEGWEHHRYAVRDLDVLVARS
jgi:DinB family protein